MYVAIDGNEANEKQRVGVHKYAFELLWGLSKLTQIDKENVFIEVILRKKPLTDLPKENNKFKYKIIEGNGFWIIRKLTPYLYKNKSIDIFFTPNHYLPPVFGLKKICTIHDLGYLKFSEQFKKYDFWQLKLWTAISINISKYIIAVSEFTKKDIVRHYPSVSKKVKVVYHGIDRTKYNPGISSEIVRHVKEKYQTGEKYILFLSTLKPSKNIEGLIDAFKIVRPKHNDYRLVIAGKKGWLFEQIFKKLEPQSLDDIRFVGYVDEKDKPALIKGARCFALPSFWEGFGIDVISSLSCGTIVVASNVASLTEIGGDTCVYCNPNDTADIAVKLNRVIEMSQKDYNIMAKKGIDRSKMFSWDKTARDTLKLFKQAYENN